jgi:hypothetical protein
MIDAKGWVLSRLREGARFKGLDSRTDEPSHTAVATSGILLQLDVMKLVEGGTQSL